MAWGYEKCFTLEHDNTLKRRIDCKAKGIYQRGNRKGLSSPEYKKCR